MAIPRYITTFADFMKAESKQSTSTIFARATLEVIHKNANIFRKPQK